MVQEYFRAEHRIFFFFLYGGEWPLIETNRRQYPKVGPHQRGWIPSNTHIFLIYLEEHNDICDQILFSRAIKFLKLFTFYPQ